MLETDIKAVFIDNNKVQIVLIHVKFDVKFIGREPVDEWLDCLQDAKIIRKYDKNIPGRYERD